MIAQDKEIRVRKGHTEATVRFNLYRRGLKPVTVIIEILNQDGKMARRDALHALAEKEQIPMITIEQIEKYLDDHQIKYASELTK